MRVIKTFTLVKELDSIPSVVELLLPHQYNVLGISKEERRIVMHVIVDDSDKNLVKTPFVLFSETAKHNETLGLYDIHFQDYVGTVSYTYGCVWCRVHVFDGMELEIKRQDKAQGCYGKENRERKAVLAEVKKELREAGEEFNEAWRNLCTKMTESIAKLES